MQKTTEISYSNELIRKAIHLSSLSIPIAYGIMGKQWIFRMVLIVTAFSLAVDLGTRLFQKFRTLYLQLFGSMLREHEKNEKKILLNGASWVLISAALCIALLPEIIAISAFTVLIVSDTAAALFGRRYGKTPFLDKSAQGTIAFIGSGIAAISIVGLFFSAHEQFYIAGILGCIVSGVIEASSIRLKMDDNLSIPLSMGMIMWLWDWLAFFMGLDGFL